MLYEHSEDILRGESCCNISKKTQNTHACQTPCADLKVNTKLHLLTGAILLPRVVIIIDALTWLWDLGAAMSKPKEGRILTNVRDTKNRPSSAIARYMDHHSWVNYPYPGY